MGTGDNISLNEIVEIIHRWFPDVKFDYNPARAGDVLMTKAIVEPLKELGWKAKVEIRDGIDNCFKQLNQFMMGAGRSKLRNTEYK